MLTKDNMTIGTGYVDTYTGLHGKLTCFCIYSTHTNACLESIDKDGRHQEVWCNVDRLAFATA